MSATSRDRFVEYLASQGIRMTRERRAVFDDIERRVVPFTVEEVAKRLGREPDGRRVSRSTVYRTLSQLEGAGMVRPSDSPGKIEFYDRDEYT